MFFKTVTFGVIAYNEQKYLPDLLVDLLLQTYEKSLIDVVLVDSVSTDNTLSIMQSFKECYEKEYNSIKIINNPKRTQPSGWNVVIKNSSADILIRIDAHARLPKDFIECNVNCINSGEYVCGGARKNIIDEDTKWKNMLLSAEQSMFGAGIASYRQKSEKNKYVKSIFHGAYRKEVIEKVGLFNETLYRTEDNEYHYRIKKAGYKICFNPKICSYYQTRNSLKKMLKQKFLNGLWIGRTLFVCPRCISCFHIIPFCFFVCTFLSSIMTIFGNKLIFIFVCSFYGFFNVIMSILSIFSAKKINLYLLFLPFIFLLLHLSYGVGTLIGVISWRGNE